MAITTTPLGFQKPDGAELVRNGDNVITANAAKSEELHQDARGRLTVIEAKNATQDTDIANARTNAVADAKTYTDGAVGADRARLSTLETAGYVPAWKATTAYVAGQRVIAPNGDVVAAIANFTSGASYNASNWTASTQDGRLGAVEVLTVNGAYSLVWGATKSTGPATTVRGTPVYGTPAKFGGTALRGAVLTASSVAPEPIGTSVTVEGWVYAAAPAAGSNPMVAWSHGGNLWVGAIGTTGYAVISISGDTPSRVNTTINICDGAWHHIAYELTRISGITYLKGFWIDGQVISLNAPSIAKAWSPNLDIGGLFSSSLYDWPGSLDEIRLSVGTRYKAAFTPATSEGVVEGRTLLLAHMTSATMDVAVRSYPIRPVAAPGGSVRYFGPFQPTDWLTDDKWEVML
jgi:hypothetical protein